MKKQINPNLNLDLVVMLAVITFVRIFWLRQDICNVVPAQPKRLSLQHDLRELAFPLREATLPITYTE
jgi:hypothetical protein